MDWLAVASANHVERGLAGGFMQVCHGKGGPLRRVKPGDLVIYYSPSRVFGEKDGYMHFTASGRVSSALPYQADMGGGFHPFRHDVVWDEAQAFPIRPLLQELDLTRGKSNWAYPFRFGLLQITEADGDVIRGAMGVSQISSIQKAIPAKVPDLFSWSA